METLLTTGQLAKLASTTKRTIALYDKLGLLKPVKTHNRYRYYEEKQILDYQRIHLLTSIGISLKEIQDLLKLKKSLSDVFSEKKVGIEEQIKLLQFNLDNIQQISANIADNGTMISPIIKDVEPFKIFFIEKTGSYSRIGEYCTELVDMFENAHGNSTAMTIFLDEGYRPKVSRMKICLIPKNKLKVKPQYLDIVKEELFSIGKVICYTHKGSGSLLSMFWKELEKYCKLKKIKTRNVPDFEIYHVVSNKPWEQKFEIFLPII